ncbi:hypothetical protein C9413_02215 [Rhizobium sp. SEMIA 4085]|uniref:Uncharacterized protein n=1 Tax=Rhizobium gallicum bv. gallicum R602sp TaxID=1041138 RepID=A0A0B4X0W9_9HYPH|nr:MULTISPECIES: hypothetical protein [Rhizobium]AJD40395.1 hypothetical protein RGR602_CH01035 [Rhizobium gallicum bv. gallicum R602sp]NNH28360.1 hypothetical protein [Rhizobium sp. SEMIA 4085]
MFPIDLALGLGNFRPRVLEIIRMPRLAFEMISMARARARGRIVVPAVGERLAGDCRLDDGDCPKNVM